MRLLQGLVVQVVLQSVVLQGSVMVLQPVVAPVLQVAQPVVLQSRLRGTDCVTGCRTILILGAV